MRYRKAGGGHIVGPAHAGAHTGAPLREAAVIAPVFRRRGTDGGPAGQTGTARRLSRFAGQSRCVPPKARQRLSRNRRENGRRCAPGFCPVCTARRRHEPPFWGGAGGYSPGPFFHPAFFGKKAGPRPGRPRREAGPPPGRRMISAPTGQGNSRASLAFTRRTARRVVAPHGASGCGGKRADDIRPYRVGQLPAGRTGPPREGAPRCGNGGTPHPALRAAFPPAGGKVTCGGGKPPPYWLAMRSARSLRYTQRSIFCSRAASSSACLACNSWRAT